MVSAAITITLSFNMFFGTNLSSMAPRSDFANKTRPAQHVEGSYVQIHKMYWYVDSCNQEHNGQNYCMFIALAFTLEEAWARENHCGETKPSFCRILGKSRQVEVNPSSSLVILKPLSLSFWTLLLFGYIHPCKIFPEHKYIPTNTK